MGKNFRGREAIAAALGVNPKTVSRWERDGYLKTMRAGPYKNSQMVVSDEEIEHRRREFGIDCDKEGIE